MDAFEIFYFRNLRDPTSICKAWTKDIHRDGYIRVIARNENGKPVRTGNERSLLGTNESLKGGYEKCSTYRVTAF